MKILFDATELSYYKENSGHRAGVFFVALNLLKEFQKKGIDITFYCDFRRYYFLKEINEFKNIPLLKENSIITRIISMLLYRTKNFPIHLRQGLIILSRFYDEYLRKTCQKNIDKINEYDVYFSPFTAPSNDILNSKTKRFRMVHDIIPILENGISKTPKNWYHRIYNTINNNDYYITNSECTKNDLLTNFPIINPDKIITSLLGANNNFFEEKASIKNEKYMFSLCTMGKRKNIIFVIKNFFKFIEKYDIQDLSLILGGSVWKKFEKELYKTLGNIDNSKIKLSGYIKEEDLRFYYSNALCFIYPSLYEGFGLPILEAMQCGCPVITSNVSSIPEVIGSSGITINPRSDEEMLKALEKMYFDEEFRNQCSDRGIKRAQNFSWEKCANNIIKFIKSSL